jgi:hypothetical protein
MPELNHKDLLDLIDEQLNASLSASQDLRKADKEPDRVLLRQLLQNRMVKALRYTDELTDDDTSFADMELSKLPCCIADEQKAQNSRDKSKQRLLSYLSSLP